jgi:hypothetical protein
MPFKATLANLAVPMPWRRKLRLAVRNSLTKLAKRQACCGHPGEPGC